MSINIVDISSLNTIQSLALDFKWPYIVRKMTIDKTLILDKAQTLQKIKRIAYEIFEQNFKEKEIVLAGIFDKGYMFAELLRNELEAISPIKITLVKLTLDKFSPQQSEITLDVDVKTLKKKVVVVLDDVINSGRTLAYSLKPFLNIEIKKLQIAVIVDRGHKSFPVSADYVGYALATSLKEQIEVELEDAGTFGVYLQ